MVQKPQKACEFLISSVLAYARWKPPNLRHNKLVML